MDFITISILFLIMFIVSLFLRYLLNGFLKTEPGLNSGEESGAPAFEVDTKAINKYRKELLGNKKFFLPDPRIGMMGLTEIVPKIETTLIERDVKVQYSRSIYVNKSFSLKITIYAKGREIVISRDEEEIERIKTEKLKFAAYEKEPKVTVGLKFAEGDFKTNEEKKTQKLGESGDTAFQFMVTPLKAEDCILTVVFSYTDKIPMPEKTTEKVTIEKTTTPAQGKPTKEHSEQTTTVPVQIVEKEIEIKSIDLVISVKSLLRLNAKQLDLVKKSALGVAALIILAHQILSGELEGIDAIISAAVSILPILGVEGADKFADTFLKSKKEDSEENS